VGKKKGAFSCGHWPEREQLVLGWWPKEEHMFKQMITKGKNRLLLRVAKERRRRHLNRPLSYSLVLGEIFTKSYQGLHLVRQTGGNEIRTGQGVLQYKEGQATWSHDLTEDKVAECMR